MDIIWGWINDNSGTLMCLISFASFVVAFFALMQTRKQILMSNRQILFDNTINSYLKFCEIFELYKTHSKSFRNRESTDGYIGVIKDYGLYFVNTLWLFDCSIAYDKPLDAAYQHLLLSKIRDIKNEGKKASSLFSEDNRISKFFDAYGDFLFAIYKYDVFVEKHIKPYREKGKTKEVACDECDEKTHRKDLFLAFNKVDDIYKDIEKNKVKSKIISMK